MSRLARVDVDIGEVLEVDCGRVAGGGAVVAHHGGRTLLVRHALPGERVRVRVTEVRSKIVRADAIEVLDASPDRVQPPCPAAHPGGCGGCDLQHVRLDTQRTWKAQVVQDALRRAGVWDAPVTVEPLEGAPDGLHWRTRMRWSVTKDGVPGLLRHRSHDVEPIEHCLLASPGIAAWRSVGARFPGSSEVRTTQGDDGDVVVELDGVRVLGPSRVVQTVGDRRWRLSPDTFWQVHPAAAATLTGCVMELGDPRPGEAWWDLYAGAGLFSASLASAVGPDGSVDAVESSPDAVRDARRALHDLAQVRLHEVPAARWRPDGARPPDGIVLDPPRTGAEPGVLDLIRGAGALRVVYVSCDPMTLARDLALLSTEGYRVRDVRAFDAFPMTHHVETVAALMRDGERDQIS